MGRNDRTSTYARMQEELNIEVKPLRLLFVRDYIAKNHYMTLDLPCFHLAELMFECQVSDFPPWDRARNRTILHNE